LGVLRPAARSPMLLGLERGVPEMPDLTEISLSFRAMNTDVLSILTLPEASVSLGRASLDKIRDIFSHNEAVLSRFAENSELSALNQSSGKPFRASPLLYHVLKSALAAARLTRGFFDPTVLPYLIAAGYSRSFERLDEGTHCDEVVSPLKNSWRDIVMDNRSRCVTLPAGCSVDLGGIGKGWTVDRASRGLSNYPGFVIDAGGDIRLGGIQADGAPWSVGLADPFEPDRDMAGISLTGGAICTSTTARRRWFSQGRWRHHLIDSRTGDSSTSDVISATVISAKAAHAEVLAKAALLMGAERGLSFIQSQPAVSGFLALDDGRCLRSPGFPEVLNVA
jgi:thiamine biosynthesis lipoprotein